MTEISEISETVELHPLLDLQGLDPRSVNRVLQGLPFVVTKELRAGGNVYQPGDPIVLGAGPNDHVLIRERFVNRPEVWEAEKLRGALMSYNRKHVEPEENKLSWITRDLNETRTQEIAARAKTKQLMHERKQYEKQLESQKALVETLKEGRPKPEDYKLDWNQ